LQKLQNEQKKRIDESQGNAQIWAKHKEDYQALGKKSSSITDKTFYNTMIPFGGKKAFFEGQIVHTNEIMVLLGDNWFVERSAKEASEIAQRRIERCDEMLGKLTKEIQLHQTWKRQADHLGLDGQEIQEPFDEEEEKMA